VFNPFTEMIDESTDFDLISQAQNGNRDALEKLVLRHQAWIYNIALRFDELACCQWHWGCSLSGPTA
jgi:hypothetical protein